MASLDPTRLPRRARQLIEVWFGARRDPQRERHRAIWFRGTEAFDAALRRQFQADHERAATGVLGLWEARPLSALALVLLLDQMPRNIFRGSPRAYATDRHARAVARRALARGFDRALPPAWRIFLYLPFEHSENLRDQRRALALFGALPRGPRYRASLRSARRHREIVARFGRFPHRNAILSRAASAAELAFLKEPYSSF